jgi:site-specific DNA-methyltransferase (cytosine-N4-specific)
MIELIRHPYKYFPYELELAMREVKALLPKATLSESEQGLRLKGDFDLEIVRRLVYFAGVSNGDKYWPTAQSMFERVNGNGPNRQSTRYSAHGLHEYKGKFNPQIVRAILNILDVPLASNIIDPFCGSGTSLLECVHLGMNAIGTDINPLAIFIANAKLTAICIPAIELRRELVTVLKRQSMIKIQKSGQDYAREKFLLSWFTPDIYNDIERIRLIIEEIGAPFSAPLLTIASNLLRDYSLQDPHDLRIRRRKTPLPEVPFVVAYEAAAKLFLDKLEDAQQILNTQKSSNCALLMDSRKLTAKDLGVDTKFDCALTSPPYATALPYIDTQRLSLVWLGLIPPSEILPLEARLVGSREVRGIETKKSLLDRLINNATDIPVAQAEYCRMLQYSLSEEDGFRRQAVPMLLYRYFEGMTKVFSALRPVMKNGAPFALIVGGNHTVLGGKRFNINTPQHLVEIARTRGWVHIETIPLQTYQRYGYHMNNAVAAEVMLIMKAA